MVYSFHLFLNAIAMQGFRFLVESYFMDQFKLNEDDSYFHIHDFSSFQPHSSAYHYLQEEHFCAITISETSISKGELDALSEIEGDFNIIWPQMENTYRKSKEVAGLEKGIKMQGRRSVGADKKTLTFEQLSQHFNMPIKAAARELNVGLTMLKKRCRELGIPRWPHRKVKSMQMLINNVQELGKETEQVDGNWTRAVATMLQRTKKMIEENPALMLDEKTKVLRQACFKENFKRRRLMKVRGACPSMTLLADASQ